MNVIPTVFEVLDAPGRLFWTLDHHPSMYPVVPKDAVSHCCQPTCSRRTITQSRKRQGPWGPPITRQFSSRTLELQWYSDMGQRRQRLWHLISYLLLASRSVSRNWCRTKTCRILRSINRSILQCHFQQKPWPWKCWEFFQPIHVNLPKTRCRVEAILALVTLRCVCPVDLETCHCGSTRGL